MHQARRQIRQDLVVVARPFFQSKHHIGVVKLKVFASVDLFACKHLFKHRAWHAKAQLAALDQ